jgi:hypothetical protein
MNGFSAEPSTHREQRGMLYKKLNILLTENPLMGFLYIYRKLVELDAGRVICYLPRLVELLIPACHRAAVGT